MIANADVPERFFPLGDDIGHCRINPIDRLHNAAELTGNEPLDLDCVARVVLGICKGAIEDRAGRHPTLSIRRHNFASPVAVRGPVRPLCQRDVSVYSLLRVILAMMRGIAEVYLDSLV